MPRPAAGVIEGLMATAGLTLAKTGEFFATLEFADHSEAVRAVMLASARAIAHSGEARVRHAVGEALKKLQQIDGRMVLKNRFILAIASPS